MNRSPLKLLLLGYYGFGNAGDELILDAIQQQLSSLQRPLELTVIASRQPLSRQPSVQIVFRRDKLRILAATIRCDVFILGGGGLIQDKTSLASLIYYLGFVLLARIFRKPVLLWSIGVETLTHPLGRTLTRHALSGQKVGIWVRDEESRELFKSLGLKRNVSLSADPVFLMNGPEPAPEPPAIKRLIVIPRAGGTPARLSWKDFNALCRRDLNLEPAVLPMHPGRDSAVTKGIGGDIPVLPWDTLEQLTGHIRQASCVLSERLHGVILSALAGVPFAGIGPVEKTGRLCAQMGAPWRPFIGEPEELIQLARSALQAQNDILKNTRRVIPELRERAGRPARAVLGMGPGFYKNFALP